jgi:hypothetical protein
LALHKLPIGQADHCCLLVPDHLLHRHHLYLLRPLHACHLLLLHGLSHHLLLVHHLLLLLHRLLLVLLHGLGSSVLLLLLQGHQVLSC